MPQSPADADDPQTLIHASAVALEGRALLVCGPSGSGKSALCLQMMACGAALIADDRVALRREGAEIRAACPPRIEGLIEARGLGLLRAAPHGPAPVAAVVDLERSEAERLPPRRTAELLGLRLPLFHKTDSPHFPAALVQYLRGGIWDKT